MTHELAFVAFKGGQGCTTVAIATAMLAGAAGHRTLIVDWDNDVAPALGLPDLDPESMWPVDVNSQVQLVPLSWYHEHSELTDLWDVVVHDYGLIEFDTLGTDLAHRYTPILVTRSCYLALRAAANSTEGLAGFVFIQEEGRFLNEKDLRHSLKLPTMAVLPYDMAVAHAIDAGLLAARPPASLGALRQMVTDLVTA